MQKKTKKILKLLISLLIIVVSIILVLEIPIIADFGDFDSYDSSSSYDSWSSDSSWDSSGSDWDFDFSWSSSDGSSSLSIGDLFFLRWLFKTPFGLFVIICLAIFIYKKAKKKSNDTYNDEYFKSFYKRPESNTSSLMQTRNYEAIKQKIFGYDDTSIEDEIQQKDQLFNKAEFLSWASDMFVRLQYAWSDRNLEEVRYFLTPELFEKTNNQVQRYIVNKQINKLERVSVNIIKLKSFEQQGDRDVLKVILDSKMIDYIIDEKSGKVLRGNPSENKMNPYILTFVRKTGVKTPEGGIKAKTMNCPNCGGATTVLSSGKCPYCGSIITTRDNGWTLSEMTRYTPNS